MGIREEILSCRDEEGMIHPPRVLAMAKANRDSDVAKGLLWDNEEAADRYRLDQIRTMIRVYIVDEDREPLYVSLVQDRARGGGYRELETVLETKSLRDSLYDDCVSELRRVQKRFDHYKMLVEVWQKLDEDEAREKGRRAKASKRTAKASPPGRRPTPEEIRRVQAKLIPPKAKRRAG